MLNDCRFFLVHVKSALLMLATSVAETESTNYSVISSIWTKYLVR